MNIRHLDHVPIGLLWSLFPILMFISFIIMPGSAKKNQPRTKTDKIINLVIGLIVVGFVGYEFYINVIAP